MNRFWEDAANIFETASAAGDGSGSEIAILIDERKSLRIVDATGWGLDALCREYQASTAYTVKRNGTSVVVEAGNGSERCTLQKKIVNGTALKSLLGGMIPHHLLHPERMLMA